MKLLTWNCCRGTFSKNALLLEQFDADICVIQECGKPETESDTCLWFGDNPKQGIAVKSSNGYRLSALPAYADVPKFVFPVFVTGPETFLMLVVWSKGKQKFRYVMGVVKAIEIYKPLIEQTSTVVIGDLNSNAIWDKLHPKDLNHSALIASLETLSIVSAYHHFFNEPQGLETRPTFFLLWKKACPYHIDFCFIPKAWLHRLQSVQVGSCEDWSPHSDHRPMLVTLSDPHLRID